MFSVLHSGQKIVAEFKDQRREESLIRRGKRKSMGGEIEQELSAEPSIARMDETGNVGLRD
jgi:hypothetical protein